MEQRKKIDTFSGCEDVTLISSTIDEFVKGLADDESLMECKVVCGMTKEGKKVYNIVFTTYVGDTDKLFVRE